MITNYNIIASTLVVVFFIGLLLQMYFYRKIKALPKPVVNYHDLDLDIEQSNDIKNHNHFVIKIACSVVGDQLLSRILVPDHVRANDVVKALRSKQNQVHQAILSDLNKRSLKSSVKREYRAKRITILEVKSQFDLNN